MSIERISQAGALACAPRELALARAHYDFAKIELRNGDAERAQQHIKEAEQNVGAAQVLTPERGCTRFGRELPASSRVQVHTSLSVRALVRVAADGGMRVRPPFGAVKNGVVQFEVPVRRASSQCLPETYEAHRRDVELRLGVLKDADYAASKPVMFVQRTDLARVVRVESVCLTARVYGETRLIEAVASRGCAIHRRFSSSNELMPRRTEISQNLGVADTDGPVRS